jgi:adenylate cyclase class 2
MQAVPNQESEVKFYLSDLPAFEAHLIAGGATLKEKRVHEVNLRFDTPDRSLTRQRRVLRLRQDSHAYITYKGAAKMGEEVSVREEIEVDVADFESARRLLETLGYEVSVMYDKYRTAYTWEGVLITLDEMPIGTFTEFEGLDAAVIQRAARHFGLDWEARRLESYLGIFDRLVLKLGLTAKNLTFEELGGRVFSAVELEMRPADG